MVGSKRPAKRCIRVAQEVKRQVAEYCRFQATNPLVRAATVTKVEVANDLSSAKIFVLCTGHDAEKVVAAFTKISPRLRTALAKDWALKKMPSFRYCYDVGEVEARVIRTLLDE